VPEQTQYQTYPEAELDARPRYFDGQFLRSQDFVDEQRYHVDRLRRELRTLHVSGVAAGLAVSADGPMKVSVSAGTAIDPGGRQIVTLSPASVALAVDLPRPASYILVVRYSERGDASLGGRENEPGTRGFTRFREEAAFEVLPGDNPVPSDAVGLARLTLDNTGNVTVSTPVDLRRYSGLRLPGPGGAGPTLTTGGDAAPQRLVLSGNLRITGTMMIDNGVIQRGGDAITATKDLGLYSRLEGSWVRYVSTSGKHAFFNDGGVGSAADLTLEKDGTAIVRAALRVPRIRVSTNLGVGIDPAAEPRGRAEVSAPLGNWLFLRQERTGGGEGGGFFVQNPWGAAGTPEGADERNRLEIGYQPATGDPRPAQLVVHSSGKVGILSAAPKHALHVGGRMMLDAGVIQRGGDPITTTSDLGLYSQVDQNWIRYVTRAGRHAFFNDGGVGGTADLTVEPSKTTVRGSLQVGDVSASGLVSAGDLEWGNNKARTQSRDNAGLRGDAGARSGFFETSAPTNFPSGASSWWHLLDVRHNNPGNNFALQLAGSFYDQRLWFRKVNDNPAQPWRRIPTTDDLGVTLDGKLGVGVDLTGTAAAPRAHVDIAQATRSGAHPAVVKGLYVTGEFGAASDGVEFRHSNGTQGVGIGFAGLYATGSVADQNLSIMPRGAGGVGVATTEPGGRLDVRVGGAAGWDRFVVTTTNTWTTAAQHVTITGGSSGLVLSNPHVGWNATDKRASVRYAPAGADAAKTYWDLGAREGGAFSLLQSGSTEQLKVDASSTTVAGTLRAPKLGLGLAAGASPDGALEARSGSGNWIFLRQDRDLGGGGGFILHNPWGNSGTPAGSDDRNRLEFAYKPATGDTKWGQLVIQGPTGYVGLNTGQPKTTLHVSGRVMIDNGVIQRGGDAITTTNDLGLYSQVDGNWCRYVTKNSRHAFFNDGDTGTDADLTIESSKTTVRGTLKVGKITFDNALVLNDYATVNPASNVCLVSPGNDRDAWIYRDSAPNSNWGIYHRNIDSEVSGLPGNSIGFIGGNVLRAYINLGDGAIVSNGRQVVTGDAERLRTIRGTVNASGTIVAGSGFAVEKTANGLWKVTFSTAFGSVPTLVTTQQYPDSNDNGADDGGNTLDNAVVVSVSKTTAYVKTGNADGGQTWRRFHFIAMGT